MTTCPIQSHEGKPMAQQCGKCHDMILYTFPIGYHQGRSDLPTAQGQAHWSKRQVYKLRPSPGCKVDNVWRRTLIPTYIQYMSGQSNVWGTPDNDAVAILQVIWDYLYGARVPAEITATGPIFSIVSTLPHSQP